MLLLVLFLKGAVQLLGDVDGGWLDLPRFPLGGAVRRWGGLIQELDGVGRGPGRWATAVGFILSSDMGIYFNSSKSQWAMGLLQLKVMPDVFFVGGGQRRRLRASSACKGSGDWVAIFIFFWVLGVVWLLQLHLYPSNTSLYLYTYLYTFLI
jgi:hypothetical protein